MLGAGRLNSLAGSSGCCELLGSLVMEAEASEVVS